MTTRAAAISPLYDDEVKAFHGHLFVSRDVGTDRDWEPIASYEPQSDGRRVYVDICCMPAHFFRIRAEATTAYDGTFKPAYSLSTGSGEAQLVALIAQAIADGMLDIDE